MSSLPPDLLDGAPVRLDRQNPYLRLQSVTVFVRDLDRSVEFFVNLLGFQLVFDARVHLARPYVVIAPPDGTANLALVSPEATSEQFKLIGRHTQIAFITEDVLSKFREWSRRGVSFHLTPRLRRLRYGSQVRLRPSEESRSSPSETAPIWGGTFARFKDPDGNTYSLVSFDEVTHAIEAERRAVAEKRESELRAAQELEIAKQVQARLFPQTLPSLESLEFAGLCLPARHVGGDYYDFLHLGQDRLGLVIGDISGKGIAAALLMANLQANLRSQCAIASDQPQRLLRSVNQLFCDNTADAAFATLFFALYDHSTRLLRYANCGHLPPLVLRSDGSLDRLRATATIMGAFKDWDCDLAECLISPGDILVLYTDGITESFSPAGEEFGEQRLADTLRRNRHLSSQALLSAIVEEIRNFSPHEQHDDITLIIAKCLLPLSHINSPLTPGPPGATFP
jgi:serine phosphatase RsbU (regulator of sigma subunit)/catechol 2,3-dioxygenase-like lactoylglutathione lyase family enzyme